MHDKKVYMAVCENASYSKKEMNPSENYPEYIFGDSNISKEKNLVYECVRNCLFLRGYDKENFGKKGWNPLGDIIKPGQNVVIKPNLVNDRNSNKNYGIEEGLECLITNVTVTRAVCDYCLVALKGSGSVTICDAPIQDCKMDELLINSGYDRLIQFYEQKKCNVVFEDLRFEQRVTNRWAVKKETRILGAEHKYVVMNDSTAFGDLNGIYEYNVLNYDKELTKRYHQGGKHIYSISKSILNSDVIINLCKPKTHRYAGITAAMKNCVGMVAEKETLPHRRIGEVSEGGDSYNGKSRIKKKIDYILDRQAKAENAGKIFFATLCRFIYGGLFYLSRIKGEDSSLKGCWHGNDTIWRTILDLNYVIRYADKDGVLCENEQRKVLNIADMIIAGQHNGPLSPESKKVGAIICSENAVGFDLTACRVMGFDALKMPLYRAILEGRSWIKYEEPEMISNMTDYCGKISEIRFPDRWRFVPNDEWRGHIEI